MEQVDDSYYLNPPDTGDSYTCHYCGDVVGWDDLAPNENTRLCCWRCKREMEGLTVRMVEDAEYVRDCQEDR